MSLLGPSALAESSSDTAASCTAGAPHVLAVRDLRKSYRTPEGETRTVVSIAEFSMSVAAQVGLKGESGSGKTTFLNLIAGIVKSDGGSIKLNGIELSGLSESKRDRLRATMLGC